MRLAVHYVKGTCCCAVLEGMDVVYKVEGQGSPSGTPKKTVTIKKSGELSGTATA